MALSKKTLILPAVVAVIAAAATVSIGSARAENDGGSSIVDKIATRFNLKNDDVQKVFDENRAEHEAKRQKKLEDRLHGAVEDKKITAEQKDQILAKHKELKSFMDSIKNESHEERHELMEDKMDELKKWAEENNIPENLIHPARGHRGRHGLPPESEN